MRSKRALFVGVVAAIALSLVGTPAAAQPKLPVQPGVDDKTATQCVKDGDTKQVGTLEAVSKTAWKVTITGDKPLCTEIKAQVANWRFDDPKQGEWPQTLVETGEPVTIKAPGTYTVAAPAREGICGQSDGYAERAKAPKVPKTLESPNDPAQPKFLQDFFTGQPAWTVDDPKKCKCQPQNPEINIAVDGCVNGKDGKVTVKVTNPNEQAVRYGVYLPDNPDEGALDGQLKFISVQPGATGAVVFTDRSAGDYQVLVVGSDKTKAWGKVTLKKCPPTTTTDTVPPTTTTDTTVPTTTTTMPGIVPVGNDTPSGGELAETGASIAVPLGISALLLILGAMALVIVRLRRAKNN